MIWKQAITFILILTILAGCQSAYTANTQSTTPFESIDLVQEYAIMNATNVSTENVCITGGGTCYTVTQLATDTNTNETTRVNILMSYRTNQSSDTCPADNYVYGYSLNGTPQCRADAGASGVGDITSVTTSATSGLQGGATTGDIDLSLNDTFLNNRIDARSTNDTDTDTQLSGSDVVGMVGNFTANQSNYYLKTEVDTQSEVETIWGTTLSTDSERTAGLAAQDECSEITNCVVGAITSYTNTYTNVTALQNWTANLSTGNCNKMVGVGTDGNAECDKDNDTIYTAGDALTLTGTQFDFDGGASPAGDLGGTWATPSVNDDSHNHVVGNIDSASSATWAGQITDESGTGVFAFTISPTFTTPTLGAATATTLNTGQGANELYAMDQNVQTTDDVTFNILTVTAIRIGQTSTNITSNSSSVLINGPTATWVVN